MFVEEFIKINNRQKAIRTLEEVELKRMTAQSLHTKEGYQRYLHWRHNKLDSIRKPEETKSFWDKFKSKKKEVTFWSKFKRG